MICEHTGREIVSPLDRHPTMDKVFPDIPWNSVEDGEPDGSPIYLCVGIGGVVHACTRHPSGNWLVNGVIVHGITHWKVFPNDVLIENRGQ